MIRSFYHNCQTEKGNQATLASENKVVPLLRAINIDPKTYLYHDFSSIRIEQYDYIQNTIAKIKAAFYGRYPKPMRVTLPKELKIIIGTGFIIREEDNAILLLVGIRSKSIKNSPWQPQDYVMYYSLELMSDPKFSTLHKRLQKDILTEAVKDGIEVIITDSKTIRKNAFAKVMDVKFRTIDIMQYYFKEVLPKAFFASTRATNLIDVFDPGFSLKPIGVNTVQEVQEVEAVEIPQEVSATDYFEDRFNIIAGEGPLESFRMSILDMSTSPPTATLDEITVYDDTEEVTALANPRADRELQSIQEEAQILQDIADIEAGRPVIAHDDIFQTVADVSEQEQLDILNDLIEIGEIEAVSLPFTGEIIEQDAIMILPALPRTTNSTIELLDDTE